MHQLRADYKQHFRRNYSVTLNFDPARLRKLHLRWVIALMVRDRRRYRLLDRLVTLRMVAWLYPLVSRVARRLTPRFAHKQAMGLEVLFR